MYQEVSTSRSTPISGRPFALRSMIARMRLGDDILVLDRDDRNVEPDHRAGRCGRNCPVAETTCSQTMSPLSV